MKKFLNKQPFLIMLATSLLIISFYMTYNEVLLNVVAQETSEKSMKREDTNNINTSNSQNSNWTGSVEISKVIREAFNPLINLSLSDAITNAENTIGGNSSAVAAFIHPLKGYLVYITYLINNENEVTKVITDVGTGEILKTKKMTIEEMMATFHHGETTKSDNEYLEQNYMMREMMDKHDY